MKKYEYNGEAIKGLFASYKSDSPPFRTTAATFPERNSEWAEVSALEQLMFPYYHNKGKATRNGRALQRQLSKFGQLLYSSIIPYVGDDESLPVGSDVSGIVTKVIDQLPSVREKLKSDVSAAFEKDPASNNFGEIIRAYPGFKAVQVHRLAHELYRQGAKSAAREYSEHAHSWAGIDIHPGAQIGYGFFIDHGTKVIIGETTKIGNGVKIYGGVLLGAKSNGKGRADKGKKRHPTIGDGTVIYTDVRVLGDINIGKNCIIGANCTITEDIKPDMKVVINDDGEQIIEPRNKQLAGVR